VWVGTKPLKIDKNSDSDSYSDCDINITALKGKCGNFSKKTTTHKLMTTKTTTRRIYDVTHLGKPGISSSELSQTTYEGFQLCRADVVRESNYMILLMPIGNVDHLPMVRSVNTFVVAFSTTLIVLCLVFNTFSSTLQRGKKLK
jgi:hypothetical protein